MKEYFLAVFSILVSGISLAQNDCQEIVQLILSTSIEETIETNPTTGEVITYYDICPGETLTLEASAQFPENNTTYFQSISNTSFSWYLDEILESNIQNFTYTFENSGGYIISLYAEDVNGCPTAGPVNVFVRVGGGATINPSVEPSSVCPGLVASIGPDSSSDLLFSTAIEGGSWESTPCEDEFSEPLSLPDGSGVTYNTEIVLACFGEGQLLTNVNDIISVDINMEHSYMGDLDIYLTAPNGIQITLFEQAGGPTWFGEATDNDSNPDNPGVGYDYGWSMNPTYNGTIADGTIDNTSLSSNGTGYILNS
nr:proprotein convertase P-domain-containing protein [Flavobacteriales bacterium]